MDKLKNMAGGLNPDDLKKYTRGVDWPIGKDDLVAVMKQNGAPDSIVSKVQGSDADKFENENDVVTKSSM